MTPGALRRALHSRGIDWPADPDDLPGPVEEQAEAHPGNPEWTSLLLAVELLRSARVALPAGLRADRLVRFDTLSATWTAHDATGERFLVRAPRAGISPVHRRLLARDGRALTGLVEHETRDGALVAPAPGAALDASNIPPAAVLAGGLAMLQRWLQKGFAAPSPDPEEVRVLDGRVHLVCLTPGNADFRAWLLPIAVELRERAGPLTPFLDGLLSLHPANLPEAKERLNRALHAHLSEQAVDLRTRYLTAGTTDRRQRLLDAVQRLERSIPRPQGKGAVGFDLEARPTQVISDSTNIRFGPEGAEAPLYTEAFEAAAARRFLRACAGAPLNSELHQRLGTDPQFTENLGRWVAGGLKLRTVRLLLERT